jgi:hypothetical protein
MRIAAWIGGAFVAIIGGFLLFALILGVSWWNIFWGMMLIGGVAAWVLALQDIWRRADLKTPRAIVWTAGVLIFPLLGTLVYYFARPPASDVRYRNETLS